MFMERHTEKNVGYAKSQLLGVIIINPTLSLHWEAADTR